MEKYGFVYIWFDRKHKRYYIGCRWGNENDKYICSSSWMKVRYKDRPQDFKRRILTKVYTNKKDLLEAEYKWLSLIKKEELGKKYYNLHNHHFNHWSTTDEYNKLSIREKISVKTKEAMNRPEVREKLEVVWESNKTRVQTEEEKEKRAASIRGQKRTEETKQNMRKGAKNRKSSPLSEDHKQKLSEALMGDKNPFFGKTHTEEVREIISKKVSVAMKGKKPKNIEWLKTTFWWNNGTINTRAVICPGPDWVRGQMRKAIP